MNVSLTVELEKYVRRKVASGLYNNASEVVREALRLLVEREASPRTRPNREPPRKGTKFSSNSLRLRSSCASVASHRSLYLVQSSAGQLAPIVTSTYSSMLPLTPGSV